MLSSWRHWVPVGIDRNEAVVLSDESQWDCVYVTDSDESIAYSETSQH